MNKPKISVIIPVYKAEQYLQKCLDSVINQTYQNLEIILVDNDSPDNCGVICDEYAAKDNRIRVVHSRNMGTSAARNIGLEVATGDWIGFSDSDDYMETDQYDYLLDMACRTGADIAQCGVFFETENSRELKYIPGKEICVDIEHIADASSLFACTVWCKLYRREILYGITFDSKYRIGEDMLFNLQVLRKANKTVFGASAKYHYVQHPDSLCNARPDKDSLVSARSALLQAESELNEYDSILKLCKELRLCNNLDMCSKLVRYGMESEQSGLICKIRKEMKELCENRFSEVLFSRKEKVKCFLIAYSWPIYKMMLLALKGGGDNADDQRYRTDL